MIVWFSLAAGLKDALNPFNLTICALFIVYAAWITQQPKRSLHLISLMVMVFAWNFVLNEPTVALFLCSPNALTLIKISNYVWAVLALACAFCWGKDWLVLRGIVKQQPLFIETHGARAIIPGAVLTLTAFFSSFVFAVSATASPVDPYMQVIINALMMPGQFGIHGLEFVVYNLALLVPMVAMFFLTNNQSLKALNIIVSCAVFLAAGIGVIIILS